MKILGVHDGHNATAALISDGVIEYAIQEERLNGIKNFAGFPALAISEILSRTGADISDIDEVAVATHHLGKPMSKDALIRHFRTLNSPRGLAHRVLWATPGKRVHRIIRRRARLLPLLNLGFARENVRFVDHHLAHAAAAYFGSPWRDDLLVLTCDGSGDDISATVNIAQDGTLRRIAQVSESHSLGLVYALATFYLGMMPNEDEYKVMGLAAYASDVGARTSYDVFSRLLEFPECEALTWRRRVGVADTHYILPRLRSGLENQRFDHVCGGLQRWTEEVLATWVRNCVRATGISHVALGGGVFMNVKVNKVIAELPEVRDLFCFPSSGDESTAIGAAWSAYSATSTGMGPRNPPIKPVEEIYWGTEYTDNEIEQVLQRRNLPYRHYQDIESEVARLLALGEVVARFKGRLEFGARALGNRSILADPSNPGIVRTVNELIKKRDFWMPFACSILAEYEREYIQNPKGIRSPYMMMAFDTTSQVEEIRAGTHSYDDTVRPQIIYNDWNPDFRRLIREFARRRGIGAVLNTSFNLHGSPIVGSPVAALDVIEHSGLRWLAIGNFLVRKA
jgi:carbamoyltransferase